MKKGILAILLLSLLVLTSCNKTEDTMNETDTTKKDEVKVDVSDDIKVKVDGNEVETTTEKTDDGEKIVIDLGKDNADLKVNVDDEDSVKIKVDGDNMKVDTAGVDLDVEGVNIDVK